MDSKWTNGNILLLLDSYKQRVDKFRNPVVRKKIVWTEIAQVFNANGTSFTVDELDIKFRSLKKTFSMNKKKRETSGVGAVNWKYYDAMEEIFATELTNNSGPTLSSTATNVAVPKVETSPSPPVVTSYAFDSAFDPSTPTAAEATEDTFISRRAEKRRADRLLELEERKVRALEEFNEKIDKISTERNSILKELVDVLKQINEK